jgi:hypothetical protein
MEIEDWTDRCHIFYLTLCPDLSTKSTKTIAAYFPFGEEELVLFLGISAGLIGEGLLWYHVSQ